MDDRTDTCQSPLSWERLVAYWAGDLSAEDEEAADLHLLGCAVCTAESQRVAAVAQALRADVAAAPAEARGPALRVMPGERRDPPVRTTRTVESRAPWRRWVVGGSGALALAAAVLVFVSLPRGASVVSLRLPAPVRDAEIVELSMSGAAASAREVRLEPELAQGAASANGARLQRLDGGGWLAVRVEAGPPFAVVVSRADLTAGRYQLELVRATPGASEETRGFYRFRVGPPARE